MATRRARSTAATLEDETMVATLDDALERVHALSMRLWAVRSAHEPFRSLMGRLRCRACGHRYPCPTLEAAGTPLARCG